MAAAGESKEPMIRGAVIRDARDWVRNTLGADIFAKARAAVGYDGEFVDLPILASSFYPIAVWDRFLAVARRELRQKTGETDLQFDMRNMRDAGSTIARTVYKFVLGIMSAKGVIDK